MTETLASPKPLFVLDAIIRIQTQFSELHLLLCGLSGGRPYSEGHPELHLLIAIISSILLWDGQLLSLPHTELRAHLIPTNHRLPVEKYR